MYEQEAEALLTATEQQQSLQGKQSGKDKVFSPPFYQFHYKIMLYVLG